MNIKKLRSFAAGLAGVVLAGAVHTGALLTGLSLANAAHADSGESIITDNIVQINETTSAAGFKHPGIRFTRESLENLRAQVVAGQDPWASYYEGMRRRWWAGDVGPRNHDGTGYPRYHSTSGTPP